jgi:hypothetical protein
MLNKAAIRIIKRGTARGGRERAGSKASTQTSGISPSKSERTLHREIAGKVSDWITDNRNRGRVNTLADIRRLFGGESSADETA